MIKKNALITMMLLFSCFASMSQGIHGEVAVESSQMPNASKGDIGTGIVSVDPYTGVGGANVPIHTFSIDGLNFNVSLNYNAKGIRVDELSSSIGLGWNLNAGGIISRTTYGLEDEVTLPSWYTPGAGGDPNFPQKDSVEGYLASYSSAFSATQYLPSYSIDDKEYDVFHFNAAGRSFDFSLKYDGSGNLVYQTYPKSEVKIEVFTKNCYYSDIDGNCAGYTNIRSGIQSMTGIDKHTDVMVFKVTDESGNQYFFEQGDVEVKQFKLGSQYSIDSGYYYPTITWNLSKVVTYSGMEINFEYKRKYMEILSNITETLYPKEEVLDFNTSTVVYDPLEIKEQYWKGYKTHITKIIYPNATTVTFDLTEPTTTGQYARCDCKGEFILKKINVTQKFDNNTENTLSYRLNQAFFSSPVPAYGNTAQENNLTYVCNVLVNGLSIPSHLDADSAREKHLQRGIRLKLKSIDRIATNPNITEPYYSFEYNATALPYRFSSKKDYYGFFNGSSNQHPYIRTNFISLLNSGSPTNDTFYLSIPYHQDMSYLYYDGLNGVQVHSPYWGTERTHNFDSMQAWVLTKVKNATGGDVEIIYQNYQLTNPDSAYGYFPYFAIDQSGTIPINCDIDPELEGKTVNDGLCVHKLITTNRYSAEHKIVKKYDLLNGERFNQGGYCWYPEQNKKVWTNYFVSPMSYFNGSNHGFSNVVITAEGLNNEQLSKTKLNFSNLIYYENGIRKTCMERPSGYHWHTMPGVLANYRMGLLLKSETFDEYNYRLKLNETAFEYHSNTGLGFINKRFFGSVYWDHVLINHEIMRPVGSTHTTFVRDSSSSTIYPFVINYNYGYDSYDNIISTTWSDSRGENYVKHKYYNYNFTGAGIQTVTEMGLRNMQHVVSSGTWKKVGNDSVLLSYAMNAPYIEDSEDFLKFPASFTMHSKYPLTSSEVISATPRPILFTDAFDFKNHTFYGSKFLKGAEHTLYDKRGNKIETRINDREIYKSSIYDSRTLKVVAEATNAKYSDIAFTSFEGDYEAIGIQDDDKGNLEFEKNAIVTYNSAGFTKAMTGKYIYDLSSSQNYITTQPLDDKKYILSFWYAGTVEPIIDIIDNTTVISSINCDVQNVVGDWRLYSVMVTTDSGRHLQIRPETTGQTSYIDEIRLHPALASMTTYTHKPLMGIWSVNDASNYIIYMEYEVWGQLQVNRDMRGNIISQFERVINSVSPNQYDDGGSSQAPGGGS